MKDSKNINKGNNVLSIIAINLAIVFIGMESLSLAFYFITQNQFFYTRSKTQEQVVEDIERIGIRLDDSIVERLHPFFGYVMKQGSFANKRINLKVNRQGFFSQQEYPFTKTSKNQFIVGIFGGSVANNLAVDEYESRMLSRKLKSYPEFANKEIVVLNFANGGYKQPQQLLVLNYFLALGQEFDMVVNIDGFNEVALANLNNKSKLDLAMPSVQHVQPLTDLANDNLSPEVMTSIVKISENKKQLRTTIAQLQNCKLALCNAVTSIKVRLLLKDYQQELVKYDKQVKQSKTDPKNSGTVYIPKSDTVLDDAAAFSKMVSMWYESSVMMNQVLSIRNIPYFQFVQPNQYYPTKRVFTQKEKEFTIVKDSPYIEGVTKGYPLLLSKVDDLQKAGVSVFSGVNILDNTKETVYKDSCCHYNLVGQELFANYISSSIIKVFRESPKSNKPQKQD
ncbi:MAG: hypothetical protein QQW96_02600 [Tychonema bourrellyi B0820]|uniref:SGNH/GDSL hydrolase family protein n=1 Tax=Tychonema bourrellyi FEM_GT703 TaxID=2040638 RepID=A0A2G4EWR3_9CYAN|nr:hypothetical protein [Tychonema bourrellyi]MDQ2096531.1 hypothetical protein [Tychonema bourrellyi B0820]PHX53985.1 hypothetical protein CP500_018605 [Tychonema bourrellyi FEM_GT703]